MSEYFHGIRIVEESRITPSLSLKSSSVIAILGTVGKTPKDFELAKPYLISNLSEAQEFVGGSVSSAIHSIFLQTQAKVVICGIKDLQQDAKTGMSLILNIKQALDLNLGFIIAPGLPSSHFPDLKALAERTKAVLILDLDEKDSKPDESLLDSISSERVLVCYPKVLVLEDGKPKAYPMSSFLAGVFARVDAEKGFWHSPSNQSVSGICGLSAPIPYLDDDPTCLANQLNKKRIITIIRDGGFRIWGNSGLYDAHQPAYRFISVVRTQDAIHRSLRESLRWAIDRGITRNLITEITAKVQEFLARLKLQGAIIDASVFADEEKNTPAAMVEGQIFFHIEFTPVFIAETITFTTVLTDKYLKGLGKV